MSKPGLDVFDVPSRLNPDTGVGMLQDMKSFPFTHFSDYFCNETSFRYI